MQFTLFLLTSYVVTVEIKIPFIECSSYKELQVIAFTNYVRNRKMRPQILTN